MISFQRRLPSVLLGFGLFSKLCMFICYVYCSYFTRSLWNEFTISYSCSFCFASLQAHTARSMLMRITIPGTGCLHLLYMMRQGIRMALCGLPLKQGLADLMDRSSGTLRWKMDCPIMKYWNCSWTQRTAFGWCLSGTLSAIITTEKYIRSPTIPC